MIINAANTERFKMGKLPTDPFNKALAERNLKALGEDARPYTPSKKPKEQMKPFYGVDGNLLVEDLWEYGHANVQAVCADRTMVVHAAWRVIPEMAAACGRAHQAQAPQGLPRQTRGAAGQ
jgi:hypothetical protein